MAKHSSSKFIKVRGARTHNLRNVDVDLPRDALVVVTGVSGSGKSTLAFDTIYAEGQRRYVESLSAYARQFLGQMDKPDVDSIEGLSPAVAVNQKTTSNNPRSTVATITEIYDYLRLLYARAGVAHCPADGTALGISSATSAADAVARWPAGTRITITASLVNGRKGEHKELLAGWAERGYSRVRVDGEDHSLADELHLDKNVRHDIELIVDRVVVRDDTRDRIVASLETALDAGDGACCVSREGGDTLFVSRSLTCGACGKGYPELEPRTFSFNSPYGACPACDGLGIRWSAAEHLVIKDPAAALKDAIAVWNDGWSVSAKAELTRFARLRGVDPDTAWQDLDPTFKHEIFAGGEYVHHGQRRHFAGLDGWLATMMKSASDNARAYLESYIQPLPCHSCHGRRLADYPSAVRFAGRSIWEFTALSAADAERWITAVVLDQRDQLIAERIVREIRERLRFLVEVGLGYLTLDRSARTLSGGESQRIRLASQIGSGLTGVLYVLDEPSIGLHSADNDKLLATLRRLVDLGNSVLVVEHDEDTIRAADWVVDIGPGAGTHGGTVIAQGRAAALARTKASVTGAYLSGRRTIATPTTRRPGSGWLTITGARENNLKDLDVRLPLGAISAISGVSGSGKSTLVGDILLPVLKERLNGARTVAGAHDAVTGLDGLDKVISIDQSPIGRTPRSNPATYTRAFDKIRALFAETTTSKIRGYKAGRYSFNVPNAGRCERCSGDGTIKIEMHFLPDVYVPCETCKGSRYNRETLEVRYNGLNIAEVLDLPIADAKGFFANHPSLSRTITALDDVGLGYLKLGHSATQLSGGEAQRVKLASELCRRSTGSTIYLLDEPTTGLHFADVAALLSVLSRLADSGNTIVVVEHNMDVLRCCDYIVDLGPAGGDGGGTLVACGTPEQIAGGGGATGCWLAKELAKH